MTLDEVIKHEEEVAEEQEKAAKEWHKNQVRKCELIPFAEMDYTHENECKECAKEHRQLAEWLKELKQLREQTRWIPVSEGLPEECKNVIVTDIEVSNTYRSQYMGNGYWECDNGYCRNRIVAWMPLPKPYKPQESEE